MSKKVLFVCTSNKARSAVAEHFFRKMLEEKGLAQNVEVLSAGMVAKEALEILRTRKRKGLYILKPFFGSPPDRGIVIAMSNRGIDISGHISKRLSGTIAEKADLILTMEESQKQRILSLYPSTEEKVFTLKEFVGDESYELKDPILAFGPDYPLPETLPPEHFNTYIDEIEKCLGKGMERIIDYLRMKGDFDG